MKWTKADITRMKSAINAFYVTQRPLGFVSAAWRAAFLKTLADNRQLIVEEELLALARMSVDRQREYAETAAHFRTHPNVYGDSTPEMIARFEGFAAESARDAKLLQKLFARVTVKGLPAEVRAYDPTL